MQTAITLDDMNQLASKKGGICISKKYVNSNTKLTWQCSEGHVWITKPSHIKGGSWCPTCAGITVSNKQRVKHSLSEMKTLARSRGGKCLSTKYINTKTELKWSCRRGHVWFSKPHDILYSKGWCRICSANRSENICRFFTAILHNGPTRSAAVI